MIPIAKIYSCREGADRLLLLLVVVALVVIGLPIAVMVLLFIISLAASGWENIFGWIF